MFRRYCGLSPLSLQKTPPSARGVNRLGTHCWSRERVGVGSGGHQTECEQTTDKINCHIRGTVAKVKGNYSSSRSAVGRDPAGLWLAR